MEDAGLLTEIEMMVGCTDAKSKRGVVPKSSVDVLCLHSRIYAAW